MKYRALAESLIPTAETVRKHFVRTRGVRRFRAEAELGPNFSYRPTLVGDSTDFSLLGIEVNEGVYTLALDKFVVECQTESLPIRLFVATPAGGGQDQLMDLVRQGRRRGIGVLEVEGGVVRSLLPALSLSLLGLRQIDLKRFPKAYRDRLVQAEETFRNGDPAKGCGRVYDLMERHTRAIAIAIDGSGLWRPLSPGTQLPRLNLRSGSWANVLQRVEEHADFQKLRHAGLKIGKPLWSRVRGLTPHRNESGHEPETREELQERDQQLRTRFEHAVDTLADLTRATPKILI